MEEIKIKWVKKRKKNAFKKIETIQPFSNDSTLETETIEMYPIVDGVDDPKKQLIGLLKFASEIEHSLMIQYLYAMYSVDDIVYFASLKKVAIQEMGHMMSVLNILAAVGGTENIHLHKDTIRWSHPDKPMPFMMEPLSKNALAKYTVIEMPESKMKDPQYEPLVNHVRQLIQMDPNPVGALYTQIYNILETEEITFLDSSLLTAERSFWNEAALQDNGAILEPMPSEQAKAKEAALHLIEEIAEQGEGTNDDPDEDNHFEEFYRLYNSFNDQVVVKNLPINPAITNSKKYPQLTLIKNSYSKLWLKLFDELYVLLLYKIFASMLAKKYGTDYGKEFGAVAIRNMKLSNEVLLPIILSLPVKETDTLQLNTDTICGPTYEIPAEFVLTDSITDLIASFNQQIILINKTIEDIQSHTFYEDHKTMISNVGRQLRKISRRLKKVTKLINKVENE